MRSYEAMVIVDPRLEEGDIQKAVSRFNAIITDGGGRVTGVDRWGVRRFAYEIDHKNNDGQWEDKLDGFFRCNCGRDMAENVAQSFRKGTRVVVVGRLQQRSWDDPDGNRRSVFEVQVDEVGPSLRWANATIEKSQRSSGSSGGDWASAPAPAPSSG